MRDESCICIACLHALSVYIAAANKAAEESYLSLHLASNMGDLDYMYESTDQLLYVNYIIYILQ